jgi:hypothetical protein
MTRKTAPAREEIARSHWESFGPAFTDQHRGWLVSALRRSPEGTVHLLWREAALEKVAIETRTSPARLVCVAHTRERAQGPATVVSLTSDGPERVHALFTEEGAHAGVSVETADGGVTELRFRVAAHPDSVDGLLR